MTVRLEVQVDVVSIGVGCFACHDRRAILLGDDGQAARAWAAGHHDPRLMDLFSRINGGPVEMHRLIRPRLMR